MHYVIYLLMFLTFAVNAQTIYKYLDDEGNVIYSEEPPTGKEVKIIEVPPEPRKEGTEASEESEQELEESPAMDQKKEEPEEDKPATTEENMEISKFEFGHTIVIAFMSKSRC